MSGGGRSVRQGHPADDCFSTQGKNMNNENEVTGDEATVGEHEDARLQEVEGDTGFPGELIGGEQNEPGSQAPPPGAKHTGTAISDAKGTTDSHRNKE